MKGAQTWSSLIHENVAREIEEENNIDTSKTLMTTDTTFSTDVASETKTERTLPQQKEGIIKVVNQHQADILLMNDYPSCSPRQGNHSKFVSCPLGSITSPSTPTITMNKDNTKQKRLSMNVINNRSIHHNNNTTKICNHNMLPISNPDLRNRQYLKQLQARNRMQRMIQDQNKTQQEVENEKKEKGYMHYTNGANYNLSCQMNNVGGRGKVLGTTTYIDPTCELFQNPTKVSKSREIISLKLPSEKSKLNNNGNKNMSRYNSEIGRKRMETKDTKKEKSLGYQFQKTSEAYHDEDFDDNNNNDSCPCISSRSSCQSSSSFISETFSVSTPSSSSTAPQYYHEGEKNIKNTFQVDSHDKPFLKSPFPSPSPNSIIRTGRKSKDRRRWSKEPIDFITDDEGNRISLNYNDSNNHANDDLKRDSMKGLSLSKLSLSGNNRYLGNTRKNPIEVENKEEKDTSLSTTSTSASTHLPYFTEDNHTREKESEISIEEENCEISLVEEFEDDFEEDFEDDFEVESKAGSIEEEIFSGVEENLKERSQIEDDQGNIVCMNSWTSDISEEKLPEDEEDHTVSNNYTKRIRINKQQNSSKKIMWRWEVNRISKLKSGTDLIGEKNQETYLSKNCYNHGNNDLLEIPQEKSILKDDERYSVDNLLNTTPLFSRLTRRQMDDKWNSSSSTTSTNTNKEGKITPKEKSRQSNSQNIEENQKEKQINAPLKITSRIECTDCNTEEDSTGMERKQGNAIESLVQSYIKKSPSLSKKFIGTVAIANLPSSSSFFSQYVEDKTSKTNEGPSLWLSPQSMNKQTCLHASINEDQLSYIMQSDEQNMGSIDRNRRRESCTNSTNAPSSQILSASHTPSYLLERNASSKELDQNKSTLLFEPNIESPPINILHGDTNDTLVEEKNKLTNSQVLSSNPQLNLEGDQGKIYCLPTLPAGDLLILKIISHWDQQENDDFKCKINEVDVFDQNGAKIDYSITPKCPVISDLTSLRNNSSILLKFSETKNISMIRFWNYFSHNENSQSLRYKGIKDISIFLVDTASGSESIENVYMNTLLLDPPLNSVIFQGEIKKATTTCTAENDKLIKGSIFSSSLSEMLLFTLDTKILGKIEQNDITNGFFYSDEE